MLDTTPARWRAGQAVIALPLLLLTTVVLGLGLALGAAIAVGAVRSGGRLLLRARRARRSASLERATPVLARCLSAELAGGVCAEEALAAAAAALPRGERLLRPLLGAALVRTALGEPPGAALAAAATGEDAPGHGLLTVAALLAVHGRAGGDPGSFDRLAAALESAVATRDDARALTAEARLAAVAVPALAGVLGVTLVLTEPAIGAGVASPLAATVLAGCALVAAAGTVLARRLAAVP
jgi:Flp pilus assembly protein TadB